MRELLDRLERTPGDAWVTLPGMSESEQVSSRNAARILERRGLIELRRIRGEGLFMFRPDDPNLPPKHEEIGRDGKRYIKAQDINREDW